MKNVVIRRDKKNPSAFDTIINKPKEHLGHFVKTTITDGEAFKIYGNLS
jgi:hypothetical protein